MSVILRVCLTGWLTGWLCGCVPLQTQTVDSSPRATVFSSDTRSVWLNLVDEIGQAVGESRRVTRPREAGLWTRKIPKSKPAVAILLEYARQKRLTFTVNQVPVGWLECDPSQISRHPDGVDIPFSYTLFESQPVPGRRVLAYQTARQKAIFSGQTVDYGSATLCLGSVIPQLTMEGETVVLTWETPPTVQLGDRGLFGLLRKVTTTRLRSLRISSTYGDFETSGMAGWVLPRLEWD